MIIAAAIVQDGFMYVGETKHRHHDIIHRIFQETGKTANGTQGFIDHMHKFHTREEAAIHALECGQVVIGEANIKHIFDGEQLFSEDLW